MVVTDVLTLRRSAPNEKPPGKPGGLSTDNQHWKVVQ